MGKTTRMSWLDWQRGLAVLFMIEVHIVNGWTTPPFGASSVGMTLRMIGGFAAPGFLYMAGLALVLADAALERKGRPAAARRVQHVQRGLWLVGVAYAFRVAEFVLGGAFRVPGGWRDILRVDILNVIGIALCASALVTVGLTGRRRALLASAAAALVVVATPFVARLSPELLAGYGYVKPGYGFGLFNWTAFALAGSAVGALVVRGAGPARVLALALAVGAAGFVGLHAPSISASTDFWGTSPTWFLLRLAGTIALSGLLMLLPARLPGLGWLTLLGRHSLATYMVSVELTYGLLLQRLHGRTPLPAALAGIVVMTGAMVLLAYVLELRGRRPARSVGTPSARDGVVPREAAG